MPNRLDIELTSARGDGSYTWRAAGARKPKGVIDGKLLSDTAKVGDVLRVEAEVEIDGMTILSVLPPKEKAVPSGRIEMLGSSKPVAAVTTVLVSEGGRGDRRDLLDSPRRGGGGAGRDRRPSRGAERGDQRRPPSADGSSAPTGERRPERRPRPEAGSPGGSASDTARPPRPGGDRRPERRPRPDSAAGGGPGGAPGTGEPRRPRPGAGTRPSAPGGSRERRPDDRQPAAARAGAAPVRRSPPRFEPGTAHREELLAGLAPEQRPIAERLAAGGIPAVRRAIAEERERARGEGRPEVSGEAILALAEQLAPSIKQATWLDRAEAAVAQLEQLSLRDLRTTVAAAAPRDEAARDLDRTLREELDRRVKKLRSHWEEQMTHALEEGRVLQALRFSAQPPEPTARFPAALVERLAASAGAAMTQSTPVERWLAILDAAAASPIRRQIHPEGLPEDPSGEVIRRARLAAGAVPALAPMVGLSMPPPPKPIKGARPPRPATRGPKRAGPAPTKPEPSAIPTEHDPEAPHELAVQAEAEAEASETSLESVLLSDSPEVTIAAEEFVTVAAEELIAEPPAPETVAQDLSGPKPDGAGEGEQRDDGTEQVDRSPDEPEAPSS